MKKTDIILITSVALYSYLFYNQSAGINFLIFTLTLISGVLVKNQEVIQNRQWIASAVGSILSGACVFIYGNNLSLLANITSLSLVAIYSTDRQSSLIFSLIYAVYSYCTSFFYALLKYIDDISIGKTSKPKLSYLSITAVPVVVFFLFFFLYREGNPIFKFLTKEINFDFLSFGWFGFTILGLFIVYAFYFPRFIPTLEATDTLLSDNLTNSQNWPDEKTEQVKRENQSALIMFGLLNFLLLFVNFTDGYYLLFAQNLPEGISHSQYVHQGVYTIITSIVLAIAIILYYFRGDLNFYNNSNLTTGLAVLWIIQNAILVFMATAKNSMYIAEYSLTYKRIGVYIYFLLTLIGLVVTVIKIIEIKSNWFLFRKNSWAFYAVLVVACFVNWDLLILNYNINYSKELDKQYLLSLGATALPELIEIYQGDSNNQYWISDFEEKLEEKVKNFREKHQQKDWQSWNLEEARVYNLIKIKSQQFSQK